VFLAIKQQIEEMLMRRKSACTSMLITLLIVFLVSPLTSAQTVVINAMNRGWFTNKGTHGGTFSSNANYFAGDADKVDEREFRNFFFFDLTAVSQPIASAKLRLSGGDWFSLEPSENYELHDVTTPLASILAAGILVPAYTDFGSGDVYGSRTMTFADYGSMVEIELNSSAITAMNATHGLFGIGGAITTLDSLRNLEEVFGRTGSLDVSELRLTLVPEPSSFSPLMLAAAGTAVTRLRRRSLPRCPAARICAWV
jgi:large repetitive protein